MKVLKDKIVIVFLIFAVLYSGSIIYLFSDNLTLHNNVIELKEKNQSIITEKNNTEKSLNKIIEDLQNEIKKLEEEKETLNETIKELEEETSWKSFTATAYSTYENGDPYAGKKWGNLTASGAEVKQGRTIAVDKDIIPLGSEVEIKFPDKYSHLNGTYIAEDTGSEIKGNKIDVYFDSYSECISFGVREILVKF